MRHALSMHSLVCLLLLAFATWSEPARAQGLIMQVQPANGAPYPAESTRGQTGIPLKVWNYSVGLPMSDAGVQTGPRRYQPVTIEKPIGNASPNILRSMLTGESLEITIDVVGTSTTGAVLLHRVIFSNARIISVTRNGSGDVAERSGSGAMTETVKFEFRSVQFDPGRPNGSVVDDLEAH